MQCDAVCCSVLCVAVCCSVLQCVTVCCSVSQYVALSFSVLQNITPLEYYLSVLKNNHAPMRAPTQPTHPHSLTLKSTHPHPTTHTRPDTDSPDPLTTPIHPPTYTCMSAQEYMGSNCEQQRFSFFFDTCVGQTHIDTDQYCSRHRHTETHMGWLRLVGSLKLQVCFA